MRDIDELFDALSRSKFRRRFRLGERESEYLARKGRRTVLDHADQFLRQRLADAQPVNDGKQTPMRGHPVFIAQHATATCCRKCLWKWHRIATGRPLTDEDLAHLIRVIDRWLTEQLPDEIRP
jgi:hypothetical protein